MTDSTADGACHDVRRMIRPVTADDVKTYREIRLAALRTDPDAFASTYEREAAFDDATWRDRLTFSPSNPFQMFVEEVDGRAVASVGIGVTEWDPAPMMVAMWVRPEARGMGSATRLIDAAVDWARGHGHEEMVLWVVRDNGAAIALYRSNGFVETGSTDVLPSNPDLEELEMRRTLT